MCCFVGTVWYKRKQLDRATTSSSDLKGYLPISVEWRVKDKSMDHCLPTLYREMTKYYIREERFKDGYKMSHALLDSKHKEEYVSYIHMDWCVSNLDEEYREKLPKEFSLAYAIEK